MLKKLTMFSAVAGLVLALAPAAQAAWPQGDASLLGYWSFDDETADDQSGQGNHASWVGTAVYNPDVPILLTGGKSIDLTARNSAVGVINEAPFDTPAHSIAFWTKGPPQGDWGNWISKTNEVDGFMIRQHGSNKTTMWYDIRGGGGDLGLSIDHSDNVWRQYVMTFDDTTGQKSIYENGNPIPVATQNGGPVPPSARTLVFGDRDSNDAPGYQASGGGNYIGTMLDDIYFFNRAITPEEVVLLFNIPEPATMALLAFGGVGLLLRRRRRS